MTRFATIEARNAYFLSRFNYQTALYNLQGDRVDLLQWLNKESKDLVEKRFLVGQATKLESRLVARRLPQKIADKRRAKANCNTRGSNEETGKGVSRDFLVFCARRNSTYTYGRK